MFSIRLMAMRTPGVEAHGLHTFTEAKFQELPEGITLGDHSDIVKFLGNLTPLVTDLSGKYREDDSISACILTLPGNFRDIPKEVMLFFRVEG